jgi:hypothetical protein
MLAADRTTRFRRHPDREPAVDPPAILIGRDTDRDG